MKTGLNSTRTATRQVAVVSAGTVAAAVATILAAHSGVARADDEQGPKATAPVVSLEEVIVTGYRKSLNAALDQKRDAIGSVDTIVAEDIAAFPELNLAESIQRIPGVSIQRDAGEGRQISVRGLGPQFTRVRINGMEALSTVSTSDANGGTNKNRVFDFNVFASELFNNITIHKTASADIDEGSLGATVDLRTARPFDYNGFTAVVGAKEDYNDLAGTIMPRYSGLISDTFHDGMFGALASVAYTKRAIVDDGSSTVRWMNALNSDGTASKTNQFGTDAAYPLNSPQWNALNSAFRPRFPRYEEYHTDQNRLGITNSLQFKPSDKTLVNLDSLYAQLDGTREEEQLEAPIFSATGATGINAVQPVSATIDARNNIIAGTFNNVSIRAEHRYDIIDTKFREHVLTLEQTITDTVKFNALAGWSQSILSSPVSTTMTWDIAHVNGYSYDFSGDNSKLPLLSYGNADVTNPSAWTLTQLRERPSDVFNTFTNFSSDVDWQATDALKLKVGGEFKKYAFKTDSYRLSSEVASGSLLTTPTSQFSQTASLTGLGGLPTGSIRSWAVPSLDAAQSLFDIYNRTKFPVTINTNLANNFDVEEKDTSGFVMADWSTDIFTVPLRGSLGVRYVHTDQNSTGWTSVGTGATAQFIQTPVEHTYNDVLPALNAVAEITKDFQVRASAAKVMSRADLGSLNPGASVSISGANKTITAGNPLLDPIRGKAYDLGFEWYFAKESLLSLAIFYKKIDSFVETTKPTLPFDQNKSNLPNSLAYANCASGIPGYIPGDPAAQAACLQGWTISVPTNTPGGDLKGSEVSFQQPFSFLPGFLSSFGTILNYTYVQSNIKYVNSNVAAGQPIQYLTNSLLQLSKNAANATLYYDNGTWSARVSGAYRSPYLTAVPGGNLNDIEGTKQTINIDFASSWNVTENLQLTLEALNLTNQFQY
ncbi:MAG: iron complex outerrane recepter protein, partial [Gammaproteobacteria bacterium]|nr:iron complex outerrane recepter protein [Gammaproteobacteria bacterium]